MTTAAPAQNYDSHRKFIPGFHGVAFGILAINFFYSLYVVVTAFSVASVIGLLLALGLIMVMLYARLFSLGVQDRVIRLEERLRLQDLLPPEQKGTIDKLTTDQLIALRFASDGEVGALVATVSADGIQNRDEIKKLVTNWRPDHQRV
jgi:uncharacterized membrane protein YciS (DUF1049 family)